MGRPKKGEERPDSYFQDIIDRIAEGEHLANICERLGIQKRTFYERIRIRPELEKNYRLALETKMDIWSDEIIRIADDSKDDWFTDALGVKRVNNEVVKRSELRIKTRQWMMERFHKRKYFQSLELTGQDGGPVTINVNVRLKQEEQPRIEPPQVEAIEADAEYDE